MARGALKGDNRFKSHQISKIELRIEIINNILSKLRSSKATFPNFWKLAEYIVIEVNEVLARDYPEIYKSKRGKMVAATLSREGSKYKHLLDRFLNSSNKLAEINDLQAKVLEYELEISELKDERSALNSFIKKHMPERSEDYREPLPVPALGGDMLVSLDASHKIIMILLESAEDTLVINDKNQIVDATRTANNVVIDKDLMKKSGLLRSYLLPGEEDD